MPKTQGQCAKIREETSQKILSGSLAYFAHIILSCDRVYKTYL